MMMVKDEWVRAAMADDSLVVELLLRMNQSQVGPSAKSAALLPVLPFGWGIRQPRSRSLRFETARKEGDSTRCSPTTPLSWSGGTTTASPSATADGFEESSRPTSRSPPSAAARSKGTSATNEITITTNKRSSRKKKTFAELKEEESFLLKEKVHLKKEIATLQTTFKEQTARNENLKRMKLDLALHSTKNLSLISEDKATSSQSRRREMSSFNHNPSTLLSHATGDDHPQSDSCKVQKAVSTQDCFSLLPDLNMMPSEDDSGSETLYGMS